MTKLAAVIAVLLATAGCGLEAQDPAAAPGPDAAPLDAPGRPDAPIPPPDAADAPAADSGAPEGGPPNVDAASESCAPDPNVCGHTCGSSDGCGHPIACDTCFGGCPVRPGDGVVCPAGTHEVTCPAGKPTWAGCDLGARTSSSNIWCCPA